jgi:hypothetical protein
LHPNEKIEEINSPKNLKCREGGQDAEENLFGKLIKDLSLTQAQNITLSNWNDNIKNLLDEEVKPRQIILTNLNKTSETVLTGFLCNIESLRFKTNNIN